MANSLPLYRLHSIHTVRVVDLHIFYADPDPTFYFDFDPDPEPDSTQVLSMLENQGTKFGLLFSAVQAYIVLSFSLVS